jgi:hypothetical protein
MNARTVFLILALLLFIGSTGVTAQEKYIPKENEELYGTWTNKQYTGSSCVESQKMVVTAHGYKFYKQMSDSVPSVEGTMQIDSKWTDAKGNIWYRTFGTVKTGEWKKFKGQWLVELSKSATVLECTWRFLYLTQEFDPANYPKEIDRNPSYGGSWVFYNIRYRAAE